MVEKLELNNPTQYQLIESLKSKPKYLICKGVSNFLDFSVVNEYPNLEEIIIIGYENFKFIASLKDIGQAGLIEISPLVRKSLQITTLIDSKIRGLKLKIKSNNLKVLNNISGLKNFKHLKITYFSELTCFQFNEDLKFIETLLLESNFKLKSIYGINNLTPLTKLSIIESPELVEISNIELIKIGKLIIEGCHRIEYDLKTKLQN